ncbi:MAG: [protein-PII] uridylyltransferase [Vitreoscilla sp.]|nr:[protein-PII] uridylyltransferase [Vitreoscilla sp.]MBP9539529.1 [protein-PII] uridylyltransferase [Vitreoscilla sp.]
MNQELIDYTHQELLQRKSQIVAEYLHCRQASMFFKRYGAELDRCLGILWQESFVNRSMCLLATGGYGRQEMYPHSDLDLAIVCANELSPQDEQDIARFVQILWDIGLAPAAKIGSTVQLLQAAQEDLTSDTAFLEARFVCGNHKLAHEFVAGLSLQRDVAGFVEGKLLEQSQRHYKARGAASQLEPNIKTCPGGLRDLHTMLWLAKAQGLRPHFPTLVHEGILTRAEAGLLMHSHKQLARMRIELHLVAGREEDRLIFDLQRQVAERLGYQDNESSIKSEQLMKQMYRATKTVKQLNGILLPMLKGRVFSSLPRIVYEIDDKYYQVGNAIAVRNVKLFKQQPHEIFNIVKVMQTHTDINQMAPRTLRAWWQAAQKIGPEFYADSENRKMFISMFRRGAGLTHILRFFNLYGMLGRYIRPWAKIVGLLQHDLFHVYPVDDHILMVVRNMRRLAIEAHSHELPFASGLMASFPYKTVLYLAALFHDIAKGRGGDHADLGVADAAKFAKDHFLTDYETDLLCWLVQDHLIMSTTSQKEDISDPEVVNRFCAHVKTRDRLIALYLLTVADVRGTNPKIWNDWKAGLLENLFQASLRTLSGLGSNQRITASRRQQAALTLLDDMGHNERQQRGLWNILGPSYWVRHEKQEILWHVSKLIGRENEAQTHIQIDTELKSLKVMVFMPNAPKLFAQLCAIFSQHQLDIVAARAYVTGHQYILDTFHLLLPEGREVDEYPEIAALLQATLGHFILGQFIPIPAPRSASRRIRHSHVAPRINLFEEDVIKESDVYVLNIVTANRRGLLANIAKILSDMDIGMIHAHVMTLDERVEDTFLLKSARLADTKTQLQLKQALQDILVTS